MLHFRFLMTFLVMMCIFSISNAQTSWKGSSGNAWNLAANWTNGVPTTSLDAIIGDANFTGGTQPVVTATASCKSLTIGGSVTSNLTVNKNLTVAGNITLNSNGTLTHKGTSVTLTGNWSNSGTYSTTSTSSLLNFSGTAQTIGGSNVTTFRKITINAGSTVTLNKNITVSGGGSIVTVNGTLDPSESPAYAVTATALTVNVNGVLKVKASTFAGNYAVSGATTLNAGSIVDYSSTTVSQTVSSSYTYATLKISGSGAKSLAASLPSLLSSASGEGNIYITSGTFDLSSYTANRGTSVAGGTINISNGASLKIGGANTFPANYATNTLVVASTVEYYGTNQTVAAQTYGNLSLSSSSGAAVKTLPGAALTIAGNLTSTLGTGSSVSYTAASNISVGGSVSVGASTTFNAGSYSHSIAGNWTNNGTFTGSTSTVTLTGPGSAISGTGTHNFYNLTIAASQVTAAANSTLTIAGNLTTSGPGSFTHSAGGTLTMSGTSKSISGPGIVLDNLSVTGTVTTSASFSLTGNLSVSGSLSASGGTLTMSGASKTISGAGTISLYRLSVQGSASTASGFSIASGLEVSGSFTASAGTATFTGTSSLSGTANLYNVTLNGTSLQLSTNAVLGIASAFTITSGSLDVTTSAPNTVAYNGTGAQTITGATYHHLILSNGNTKTAGASITVNGDLTIASSTTFSASSYTHYLNGGWINNGTFTAGSSTISFTGSDDQTISGATTFNILTLNKSSFSEINLLSNVSAATVNMTVGSMLTGSNTLTITNTRTGNGIILGNIQRTHAFTTGTAYEFESPANTITFSSVSSVSSITVSVVKDYVSDFPFGGSVNRSYTISVPSGTYTATLRLHYEDAELNGNGESSMALWKYNGSTWNSSGKTGNNTTTNYVEQSGLTSITNRWTFSDNANVVQWNGSVSSDWNTAANWTTVQGSPATPPSASDIVTIGYASFTNQPVISTAAYANNLSFGSVQAATLTLTTGGSLTSGNISGYWTGGSLVHTINTNGQNLTVNGDLILSDGTTGHALNLNIGTGNVTATGSVIETGGANITFSGAGTLSIGHDFAYSSGTFTAGSGTVVYNGSVSQILGGIAYNHLTISKTAGVGSLDNTTTVSGNLNITSGELENHTTTTIAGNVTIGTGTTFHNTGILHIGGHWNNSGTYTASGASIYFDGSGTQNISATTFNNFNINKPSGTAVLTGNVVVNGNLAVTSGSLDLQTYSCNRSGSGGTATVSNGATLTLGGTNNWPAGFDSYSLAAAGTVVYNGASTQNIAGATYGNLVFSNGSSNAKTLTGQATVNGNLTINSGATVNASSYTVTLFGNWTNSGTFSGSTGTVILNGSSKTITGNTTFNRLTVYGSYTVSSGNITIDGMFNNTDTGTFDAGSSTLTFNGDFSSSGIIYSSGTITFSGTVLQTIGFKGPTYSTGIINFNGSVAPVLNSSASPSFTTLNINNTGGITPAVDCTINGPFTVGSGAVFNAGIHQYMFTSNFTNNGTINSNGVLHFIPTSAVTAALGSGLNSTGTVNFDGTGQISVSGTPATLQDVVIANTNAAGISPASGWNIGNDLTISSNALFNAGSYSYTIGGDVISNGTLNGGTSSFTLTAASGNIYGSPDTYFYDLINNGVMASQSEFFITHNFTINNSFDASLGIVEFKGSTPSVINGTAAPYALAQWEVEKSSGAVVTLTNNITGVTFLDIESGVLDLSSYTITEDAGGGSLNLYDFATLKIGGTNSLPSFTTYIADTLSTIEFTGTTQTIPAATPYGNLTLSAAGTKTPSGALTVLNNFTLSNATLAGGSYTHTVAGNWSMTSGTFTNTGTTILLNGTNDQDISSTGAFNHLTLNKASGVVTQSAATTVNGTLTLTGGKMDIGSYNLTIGPSGGISGASAASYFIAAGTGTLIQQVINGGAKVFPVGTSSAYLPATLSLTAGSTTDNFNIRLLPAVYSNGVSGSTQTANVVNATWMIGENTAGGSNATVAVQWPATLELSGFNRLSCWMGHYISGNWDYGSGLSATGSDPYTVNRTAFTSFSPFIVTGFITLPVRWLLVSGQKENGYNHILWSVAEEYHQAYYIIEASADGSSFYEAGRITARNGQGKAEYDFTDRSSTTAATYYRIKQVDEEGRFSYSVVVKITAPSVVTGNWQLSPTVVTDRATLSLQSDHAASFTLTITDAGGRLVHIEQKKVTKGYNTFPLGLSSLASGTYFLQLSDGTGAKEVKKMVKR
jgi:hypothetical protein